MAGKTVVFESDVAHLILVRQRKLEQPLPTGGWHTVQKSVDYEFVATPTARTENGWCGVLRVKEGEDKLSTDDEGWLKAGEEVGEERDAPTALMAHRSFGTRFWLAGHPPGTLYPRPADFRADVRRALTKLEEEALVEMVAKERSTHQRADLISEAEDALALVRQERAELDAATAEREAQEEASYKAPKTKPKPKAPASA